MNWNTLENNSKFMVFTSIKGTPERSICLSLEGHDLDSLHSQATPQSWYLWRRMLSLSQVCNHPWTLQRSKDKYNYTAIGMIKIWRWFSYNKRKVFSVFIFGVKISFQYNRTYIFVMIGVGNLEDDIIAFGINNLCSLWCIFVNKPIL